MGTTNKEAEPNSASAASRLGVTGQTRSKPGSDAGTELAMPSASAADVEAAPG